MCVRVYVCAYVCVRVCVCVCYVEPNKRDITGYLHFAASTIRHCVKPILLLDGTIQRGYITPHFAKIEFSLVCTGQCKPACTYTCIKMNIGSKELGLDYGEEFWIGSAPFCSWCMERVVSQRAQQLLIQCSGCNQYWHRQCAELFIVVVQDCKRY